MRAEGEGDELWRTYEGVMAHVWMSGMQMNEIDRTRALRESVMSHYTYMNQSCHTYECVVSYIWISHGAHMYENDKTRAWKESVTSHGTHSNASRHAYEWVMSHEHIDRTRALRKSVGTNESCHMYECVVSHIWVTRGIQIDETDRARASKEGGWIMSHIRMRHITRTNEAYHTYGWVMSQRHAYIWSEHTYMSVTHTYIWSAHTHKKQTSSFIRVTHIFEVSTHTCQ